MQPKRILTMQDLSCVGQCSLTVALPVLSAMGVEAAVLPTAILSTHTMFKKWTYFDLTCEIENIYNGWRENDIKFEGFLLGYLGKKSLMDLAEKAIDDFSTQNAPIIIDPVFGDNGKLYGGFDLEYVKAMRNLVRRAHIVVPNLTELCFMLGWEYPESYDKQYIESALREMKKYTSATVILTGVQFDGKIGEAILADGNIEYVMGEKLPTSYHGTGDIFASVFTANYLNGKGLAKSCENAGKFVADCIRSTPDGHFYGVCFEKVLNKF